MGDKAVERLIEGYRSECICIRDNKIIALDIDEALSMTTPSRKELFELHDRLI